jgi:hypothetical protein
MAVDPLKNKMMLDKSTLLKTILELPKFTIVMQCYDLTIVMVAFFEWFY